MDSLLAYIDRSIVNHITIILQAIKSQSDRIFEARKSPHETRFVMNYYTT